MKLIRFGILFAMLLSADAVADTPVSLLKNQGGFVTNAKTTDAAQLGTIGITERSGNPTPISNVGYFFTKDVGGVTQLFYESDNGTVVQLTPSPAPSGAAGGDLSGSTYPNPVITTGAVTSSKILDGTITDVDVNASNKDGANNVPSLRTLGNGSGQALAGNDSSVTNSRPPNGSASGDLSGSYPNPVIATGAVTSGKILDGTITDTDVSAANKDGTTSTPSMRTLGTGSLQCAAGDDTRIVNAVQTSRTVTSGTGLTGGGDLSANRTLNVGANADGSIVVNADDVQVGVLATDGQHGNRGGGATHSAVTTSVNGFMSASDKTKIDGIDTGAQVASKSGFTDDGTVVRLTTSTDQVVVGPSATAYTGSALTVDAGNVLISPLTVTDLPTPAGGDILMSFYETGGDGIFQVYRFPGVAQDVVLQVGGNNLTPTNAPAHNINISPSLSTGTGNAGCSILSAGVTGVVSGTSASVPFPALTVCAATGGVASISCAGGQCGWASGAHNFTGGTGTFSTAGTLRLTIDSSGLTVPQAVIVAGETSANGGVGRSTNGTLTLGTDAQSTAITIGASGITTTNAGALAVTQAAVVTGEVSANGDVGRSTNGTLNLGIDTQSTAVSIGKQTTSTTINGVPTFATGANGQVVTLKQLTESKTVSGAVNADTTIQIPQDALVYWVTVRITTAFTGPATWNYCRVSDGVTCTRYGSSLANTVNGTFKGSDTAGDAQFNLGAATAIRIRATDGITSFTGGVARVTIHYLEVTPPTS